MSQVKFKEETITSKFTEAAGASVKGGKHEGLAHEIGEKLTAGGGANGYLAVGQLSRSYGFNSCVLTVRRHTSSNCRRIRSAPRC
jgi:hypothetical protein